MQGYLLLADISGYTRFVASTPAAVSGSLTATLLDTLVDAVEPPFHVANVEGDAVFLCSRDDDDPAGQTVLDAIDRLYCAFTERVHVLRYGASCPEDPAHLLDDLDLKMILHHGEYVVDPVADREQMSGAAVILLHRLAKNTVYRDTGVAGYVMATTTAIDRMGLRRFFETFEARREEVDHLGSIDTYIYPLAPVWERYCRGVRRFVEPTETLLMDEMRFDLPVPPCRSWEICTEPGHRMKWIRGIKGIGMENLDRGRAGLGTIQNCDHGDGMVVPLEVIDWRPFDYISFEISTPLGLSVHQTIELKPLGNGTRVAIRIAAPPARSLLDRWRMRGRLTRLRAVFEDLYADAGTSLARLASVPDAA